MTIDERIVYIDSYFAVINKTAGELCERQQNTDDNADENWYVPDIFSSAVEKRLGSKPEIIECVHRIDRPVSGLVVLALTQEALKKLSALFAEADAVQKKYLAIIEGGISAEELIDTKKYTRLASFIVFNPSVKKAKIFDTEIRKSKKAVLDWRLFGTGDRYRFLEIALLTGRTHQIRAQLAHYGMHIKGDVKYGARRQDTIPGIRLHARTISFKHPFTKKSITVHADVPVLDPLWSACLDAYSSDS